MGTVSRVIWVMVIVAVLAGVSYGNWIDSFDGGAFQLATWQFPACPEMTGTFAQTFKAGPDENSYLVLKETTSAGLGGAMFGAGFGSDEKFKDVRVGAVVNVAGDASRNYYGFLARANYFIDPDGSVTGVAPGFWATCYILHINWDDGPANLRIDLEKVVTNQNIMRQNIEAVIPRLDNARSYYAELEVIGSGPVYVTGSLYEYKGGPLVARTPTMVDTNGNDPWEDPDKNDAVLTEGISGIFAQNEDAEPVGFYTTFDDVSSVSDGPAAAGPSPANGATGISTDASLSWVEGQFATDRQLWFGPAGDMQLVDPAPAGAAYDPGMLEPGVTYEWRVDQVGASGVVEGRTWQFTTGQHLILEGFESYADAAQLAATWVDNITMEGFIYTLLDTGTVFQGAKAMRLEYENQYDPFLTEATRTFDEALDWTVGGLDMLTITFRGKNDNVEQQMYVRVEDAAGNDATVPHPLKYAVQSEPWRMWDIPLAEFAGVDVTAVKALTIGVGDGESSGQADGDLDMLYIDNIGLRVQPDAQ